MAAYSAIARYLLGEAASGTTPTSVADSVGSANLAITYNSNGNWTSIAAGNGFDFTAAALSASGAILRSSAGVFSALDGATEGSFTLLVDFDSVGAGGCRGFHFGSASGAGYFHLTFNDPYSCAFGWADEDAAGSPQYNTASYSSATLTSSGVKVFHVVVDTTQAVADDRVKIYMDGSLLTFIDTNIEQNTAIPAISASHYFTLGNGGSNSAGFDGRIFFFEVGTGQLTGTQISDSVTALLADNDTDPYAASAPPELTAGPTASNITASGFDISGTTDADCTVSLVVVNFGDPQPNDAAFDASTETASATASVEWTINHVGT